MVEQERRVFCVGETPRAWPGKRGHLVYIVVVYECVSIKFSLC